MSRLFSLVPDTGIRIVENLRYRNGEDKQIITNISLGDNNEYYVVRFAEQLKQIDYQNPVRLDVNHGIILVTDPDLVTFMGLFYWEKDDDYLIKVETYTRMRQRNTSHIRGILVTLRTMGFSTTAEGGDWFTIRR